MITLTTGRIRFTLFKFFVHRPEHIPLLASALYHYSLCRPSVQPALHVYVPLFTYFSISPALPPDTRLESNEFYTDPQDGEDYPITQGRSQSWTVEPLRDTRFLLSKMKTGFFSIAVFLLLQLAASQPHRKLFPARPESHALTDMPCRRPWAST